MKNIYKRISIPLALILGVGLTAGIMALIRPSAVASAAGTAYYVNAATSDDSRSFAITAIKERAQFAAESQTLATTVSFTLDLTASNAITGVYSSSAAWGDYDNDGDLDILLTGSTSSAPLSSVYENTVLGFAENVTASSVLTDVSDSSAAWGDYDNDGDLDILLTGQDSTGNRLSSVFENTGSGFSEDISASSVLSGVYKGSAAWGDYDNDGDLDILLTGQYSGLNSLSSVYENTGTGFTENITASSILTGVSNGSAAWGDYDNDGDLDILLTGEQTNFAGRLSSVFENTGAGFTLNITASNALSNTYYGSAAWGDYDNDGDLDILLTGIHSGFDNLSSIYENTGPDFIEDITASNVLTGVAYGSAAWGDYDNDGDLDILLTGTTSGISGLPSSSLYENTGTGFTENITASSVLPGVSNGSSIAWGDYDNDGDLDILLAGADKGGVVLTKLFRNNALIPNTPPSAPSGLGSSLFGDQQVSLGWSPPAPLTYTTPYTGLSYNLRVGTSPGQSDILAPMSCVGSCGTSSDGYRQIPALGGANHGLTAALDLPPGIYYWSVQAVDHTFAGSPWAVEGSFSTLSEYELSVSLSGSGSGIVTSDPAGISCGADCSESYPAGTVVTLTHAANIGSTFSGWDGACNGGGDCVVTMDAAKSVTASFSTQPDYELSVSLSGTGSGIVTSDPAGISCGADCSESYPAGTVITLTHAADFGSTFSGWGGACKGTGECVLGMDAARNVTASFDKGLLIDLPIIIK